MDLRIRRNKKGIIFTIISIVIAIFFTIVFSARIEKPIDYKSFLIETRVNTLSDYMSNFFDYTRDATRVSGYSAFQGLIQDINNTHRYYNETDEFESNYTYCLRTGNLTDSKICPNMTNRTLPYYLNYIRDTVNKEMNIKSNYTINSITINQTIDAFAIELTVNITLKINDAYANLTDTRLVASPVPIEGLPDPLFIVNGSYNQNISEYKFRTEGDWNETDLASLYYNHSYRAYINGISFINRIKGNFTPSIYGIESFVNYTNVTYNESHSLVDYLFWRNITSNCSNSSSEGKVVVGINITTFPPKVSTNQYFQLDEDHRASFIRSGGTVFTCPQT